MTNFGFKMTILVASFGAVACSTDVNDEPSNTPPPGSTSGDESTTFDHENDGYSPWELIDRLAKEGPPRYTSKVHSCPKVRYATLDEPHGVVEGHRGTRILTEDVPTPATTKELVG